MNHDSSLCASSLLERGGEIDVRRTFNIKVKLLCRRVQTTVGGADSEDVRSTDLRTVPYDVDECAPGRDSPDASGSTPRNTTEQTYRKLNRKRSSHIEK